MKSMRVLVGMLSLLLIPAATGPASAQSRRPVAFSTQPQIIELTVRSSDSAQSTVEAKVAYTITSANPDDTLTGTLSVSFANNPGKRTAPATKPGSEIPRSISESNVVASFHKQTACPRLKIEIGPLELTVSDKKLSIERFELTINETRDEMSQLLCFWTKQINTDGLRRGIVSRINRLITGDDPGQ